MPEGPQKQVVHLPNSETLEIAQSDGDVPRLGDTVVQSGYRQGLHAEKPPCAVRTWIAVISVKPLSIARISPMPRWSTPTAHAKST